MKSINKKILKPVCELIILLLIAITVALLAERFIGTNQKYTYTFLEAFDTETKLIGYDVSEEKFLKNANLIKERLLYYNELFDIYNSYDGINNIKTINDNAGIKPVKVDKEIINLLKLSIQSYYDTSKQVNMAMGSVLEIWHEYREEGLNNPDLAKLPEEAKLLEANKHTDINNIIIDEENFTVYLKDSDMSLDVGSIGKGYAAAKTAEYARELNITNMLINVGGNVCVLGTHSDGSNWKLGIQNPDLESDIPYIEKVSLSDGECIVTSGDYQRYYYVSGKRYCHIIDPDTLFPANSFRSVSVITTDSALGDALSTALFNMTIEEGKEYVDSLCQVEAMWVLEDGTKIYSENFESYICGN